MVIMEGDRGSSMLLSVFLIHIEIGVRVKSMCACVHSEGVYIIYYLSRSALWCNNFIDEVTYIMIWETMFTIVH